MKTALVLCAFSIVVLESFVDGCSNLHRGCRYWANKGYCNGKYVRFMSKNCKKSCNLCESAGPAQCGYKPSVRIVGGTEAPHGAWPWQAQIMTTDGYPFCGGTLVHPQWVVTAAHCVPGKSPGDIRVRLGAHKRKQNVGTEQLMKIKKIISHQSYRKPYGMAHDIAMIKLAKPAEINKNVKLACLPRSRGSVADGKGCWVTGFGRLSSGGPSPDVLQQVKVPIVSDSKCRRAYGSLIHDSMICAGLDKGGKDSCQGDSGGPMVCEAGGKFFLEGVVSWGIGCAASGKYGVYARVRYLRKWIDKTMNAN